MTNAERIIEAIEKNGGTNRGRGELLKYLNGGRLSARQAAVAKCYDCMAYGADGRQDCGIETCALYPLMPYSSKPQAKKPFTGKSKDALFGRRGKQ